MKRPLTGAAILVGLLAADAGWGSELRHLTAAVPPAPPAVQPDEHPSARPDDQPGALADMNLRRWPEGQFYQSLTERIDTLSSAHGPERPGVFLDMAELFLGQMMLYEAGDVLDGLAIDDASDDRRRRALGDAVRLLGGEAVPEVIDSPLADMSRPDRGLWLALNAIAQGDAAMLRDNLGAGLAALAYQTRAVARSVLPILTEAVIEAGEMRLAGQALGLVEGLPDLSSAPVGYYLRGRAAELSGNFKTALDAYLEASKGWDRYAARARLALVDMARADGGSAALLAARDVLEQGSDAWRGDRYELQLLQRLAEVYSDSDDRVNALMTNAKLMARFPGTPAAMAATERAAEDLATVYRDGAEGRLPLARWLSVHLQLVPSYRYFPGFAGHTETLADRALKIGGTDLAAVEYRRSLVLLKELDELPGQNIPPQRFVRVRLKLARALIQGGLAGEARETLAAIETPQDPDLRQQLNALKSEVLAELGETEELLRTHVAAPGAGNLRDVGRALWQAGDWAASVAFYNRLWAEFPGRFGVEDASYLLIAARHAGDKKIAHAVVDAFPGLTDSERWIEIAQSLLQAPAALLPLSRDAADSRLESLDRALGHMKDTGL